MYYHKKYKKYKMKYILLKNDLNIGGAMMSKEKKVYEGELPGDLVSYASSFFDIKSQYAMRQTSRHYRKHIGFPVEENSVVLFSKVLELKSRNRTNVINKINRRNVMVNVIIKGHSIPNQEILKQCNNISLNIIDNEMELLPMWINELTNLKKLALNNCSNITTLPESIGDLVSLNVLVLRKCYKLESLPESIGNLENLNELHLIKCNNLESLPVSIGNLENLKILNINDCVNLTELPESIGNLKNLKELELEGCVVLNKLPQSIGNLENLNDLNLIRCHSLTEEELENVPKKVRILWQPDYFSAESDESESDDDDWV